MAYSEFGKTFGETFKEAWKSGAERDAERDKERRVLKRAKRAREDLLIGNIGGYSPEAYEQLITERDISTIPSDEQLPSTRIAGAGVEGEAYRELTPLEALRSRAKGVKGRDRLRELASQEGALARISKGIEAEAVEKRLGARAETGAGVEHEFWLKRLNLTKEDTKDETQELREIAFANAAGASGMEWDEFTAGNDLDATRDKTNPQWMAYSSSRNTMLKAEGDAQRKLISDAVHSYAFRKGQLLDRYGNVSPLEGWMAEQYPAATVLHGAGTASTELEQQVTERRTAAEIDKADREAKAGTDRWLKTTEAELIREQLTNLISGPPPPEGMKAVPSRKPWPSAIQGMIRSGYAFEEIRDGKRIVYPRDEWVAMYKDKPKRFELYSRYVDLTGRFPVIGTPDHRLERELMDLVAKTTVMVTGLATNAVMKNSTLTEVGVEVDKFIDSDDLKKNQRTAVVSMVMKEVRAAQFADATNVGAKQRAYDHLADEAHAGMSSTEPAPDGRPRWVIIMMQKEDDDGNPIMVGQHFRNPTVKLNNNDIRQINIRLNSLGEVGRSGVPRTFTDPETGRSGTIKRDD